MPAAFDPDSFPKLTDRPIIGVLTPKPSENLGTTYALPATYVKWLQGSGARVVPIIPGHTDEYYKKMFTYLNGIFIPGGPDTPLGSQRPVTAVVEKFLEWSIEAFDTKGDYFPIWGTCLGIEVLLTLNVLKSQGEEAATTLMQRAHIKPGSETTILLPKAASSRMIGGLSEQLQKAMVEEPINPYLHHWGVPVANFDKYGMEKFYRLLGLNRDLYGLEYVTFVEGVHHPIYATMNHYEKICYQWSDGFKIDRRVSAIQVAQHFANFFVQECCKSGHKFPNPELEWSLLIDNHSTLFTAPRGWLIDNYYAFHTA